MKEALMYLIEMLLCGGAFMLLYRLLVVKKASFLFARIYIIVSVVLSAVIPALRIPVYPSKTVYMPIPIISGAEQALGAGEIIGDDALLFLPEYVLMAVFGLGVVVMGCVLAANMVAIRRIRRSAGEVEGYEYPVYCSEKIDSPFSYRRSIYIREGLEERELQQVVAHEASHIRHHHSTEKTVMAVLRLVMWYNPFVWMAYRSLVEVHEYQADSDVLETGCDMTEYRKLILKQILGHNPDIACGLNNSLTKKRFITMEKNKNKRHSFVSLMSAAFLVSGLMLLFGFTRRPAEYTDEKQSEAKAHGVKAVSWGEAGEVKVVVRSSNSEENPMVVFYNPDDAVGYSMAIDTGSNVNSLGFIDPDDVESMNVLKGEAAVAKYGDEGRNGVVEVTLKPRKSKEKLTPLAVVDGEVVSIATLDNISGEDMEKVDVLKGEAAVAKYGERGRNGVIEVVLKPNIAIKHLTDEGADEDEHILVNGDSMPTFQGGGLGSFRDWVMQNVKYPSDAVANKIEGKVVAQFIVEKDGSVSNVVILDSPHEVLSNEMVHVLESAPNWEPAEQNGKNVRVKYTLPIDFKL